MTLWQEAIFSTPLNFRISLQKLFENDLLVVKLWFIYAQFGVENPIVEKFISKIEILSTRNLIYQKIATRCPPTFLQAKAATAFSAS